jgi:hypothetical protein
MARWGAGHTLIFCRVPPNPSPHLLYCATIKELWSLDARWRKKIEPFFSLGCPNMESPKISWGVATCLTATVLRHHLWPPLLLLWRWPPSDPPTPEAVPPSISFYHRWWPPSHPSRQPSPTPNSVPPPPLPSTAARPSVTSSTLPPLGWPTPRVGRAARRGVTRFPDVHFCLHGACPCLWVYGP